MGGPEITLHRSAYTVIRELFQGKGIIVSWIWVLNPSLINNFWQGSTHLGPDMF